MKKKTVQAVITAACLLLALAVRIIIGPPEEKSDEKTVVKGTARVDFIDVGQGDATLIESGGKFMLIDTGDRDNDNAVEQYLRDRGVEKLDLFVITHPHADHMGEAAEIVGEFDIGTVIMPSLPDELVPTTMIYEQLLDAMDEKGKKFHAAKDEQFSLGDCTVKTFAAEDIYEGDCNNYSVIVKIIHGENSFLITGDCEIPEEQEMLGKNADFSANVLKAGHHGSDTSSSKEWLEAVSPQYAVVSCGEDNRYGHPHAPTVKRLKKYAEKVYITAKVGSVHFESDGKELTVFTGDEE